MTKEVQQSLLEFISYQQEQVSSEQSQVEEHSQEISIHQQQKQNRKHKQLQNDSVEIVQ
jgi:hypothetical protein